MTLACTDINAFKLFLVDVGLLGAMASLDPLTLLDGNALFTEFKGALTEQFVLQSLIASNQKPYYWTNKNGAAEIDFLVERPTSIIPLDVKSAQNNIQAKSLRFYRDSYAPPLCLRASLRPIARKTG